MTNRKPSHLPVQWKLLLGIPSAIAFLALLTWVVWKVPQTQVGQNPLKVEEKARIDAETAARVAIIQGIGGLFLFGTAAISFWNLRATQRNVEIAHRNMEAIQRNVEIAHRSMEAAHRNTLIAEEKQVTERFSKAIEMLGNENSIHIRLGGIYALERIANDSDKDYWQVMEVLTAFVRERSPAKPKSDASNSSVLEEPETTPEPSTTKEAIPPLPTDIQAVLTVIGRRKHSYLDGEERPLDLSKTDLPGADLRGVKLQSVLLEKANLRGANLERANLQEAGLGGANLRGANLGGANLRGANLERANLQEAGLWGANLQEAIFGKANLQRAILWGANLQRAILWGANLQGAILGGANLQRTGLLVANLQGADLQGANLQEADLTEANLEEAKYLTQEQLDQAKSYEGAHLPKYLLKPKSPNPPNNSD